MSVSGYTALSMGMRNAVYSMEDVQGSIDIANKRLATGKKVNSALDNAGAYFRAQGLQKDSRDMNALMDGMERAGKVISKAAKALDGMRQIAESAQALSRQALQLADTDANRNVLRDQIAVLMNQFNNLARDSLYEGQQVLQAGSTALTNYAINTNVSGSTAVTVVVQNLQVATAGGVDNNTFTTALTGITPTTTGTGQTFAGATSWLAAAGTTLVSQTVTAFTNILSGLQTAGANVATNATLVDIRKDFTKSAVRSNNEFADYLVLADINEEGANLAALQTKQQLAVQALSLASKSDQAILRLF